MRKGYGPEDILRECLKLQDAGIEYNVTYLNGLAGAARGEENALNSAKVFSRLRPFAISVTGLTVFPESDLYGEIEKGVFTEAPELEKLAELYTLIDNLYPDTPVTILANTVSNTVPLIGMLPYDRKNLLASLRTAIGNVPMEELERYRKNIVSL